MLTLIRPTPIKAPPEISRSLKTGTTYSNMIAPRVNENLAETVGLKLPSYCTILSLFGSRMDVGS